MTTSSALALPIVAVAGLRAEERRAAAAGIVTIAGGGDGVRLAKMLEASLVSGARGVISFGIAGGLAPGLPAGTVVIADAVSDGSTHWKTDLSWHASLQSALPQGLTGTIYGSDAPIADVLHKAVLHRACGAVAVDMESHVAARAAAEHGVPFAILRVIADPAERALPHAALVGMRPDGSADILAVLQSLARRPGDLPDLIRTAQDARAAFASLGRSRSSLDASFGFDMRAANVVHPRDETSALPVGQEPSASRSSARSFPLSQDR